MRNFKMIPAALAASVLASAVAAPSALAADVDASAAVASSYLFRGVDLGNGSAAVSGDINISEAGFYAGVWGSSGDDSLGAEYDIYGGWSGEVGGLSVDVGALTYMYPKDAASDSFGDFSEVYVSLGVAGVTLSIFDNVAGGNGYIYYALSGDIGPWSLTLGMADPDNADDPTTMTINESADDYVHFDATYNYNDNLSFTLSKVVDDDENAGVDDDTNFVVTYSIPLTK